MSEFNNIPQTQTQEQEVSRPKRPNPRVAMLQILKQDPSKICNFPEAKRTNEIISFVLSVRADSLQYLNEREQTKERCMFCVERDGLLLRYVLDQTDKYEVICKAIEQNYESLQYVHHQTPDLCEQVIKARPDAIRFVKINDPQLYYLAVHLDPSNIKWIPAQFQTEDIMRLASGRQVNLDHVANPTPEIVATMFNNDRSAIDNIDAVSKKYPFLKIEFDNATLKISYNDNIKVLIHDIEHKKYYYTHYTKDLLNMIFSYIRTNSGDRGLNAAKALFNKNKNDVKAIEKDSVFVSGLFVIENGEKNYELWEKTVVEQTSQGSLYNPATWVYSTEYTTVVKTVKLLRTYCLMEMEFQQYS